jgi:hypothetical protein
MRPVPLALLVHQHAAIAELPNATNRQRSVTNLVIMAFFFLLNPGEYYKSGPDMDSHPFRLRDIIFSISNATFNAATAPITRILQANYVPLYFTNQKNRVS